MEVGDSGRRQRAKWMHWEWQVACQYPICHTLLLASCKSWETLCTQLAKSKLDSLGNTLASNFLQNTLQAAVSGSHTHTHLSLDSLSYLTLLFLFWLFASTQLSVSTLKAADLFFSSSLLLLPPASSKPPPWLLDDESTILQAFFCLLLHLIMIHHPLPLYLLTSRSFSR